MSLDEEKLDNLLDAWELARSGGKYVSASELCRDCPEYLAKLREQIADLLNFERYSESQAARIDSGRHPSKIGQYTVQSMISHGGMGIVYRCSQQTPSREVAVKLLRFEKLTPKLLARFEREIDILAMLTDPAIARIFDAGITDVGRGPQPYFVMELVIGKPVTEFAETRNLGERDRLKLIARVAGAVHSANEKSIIHRDLKPSNILVDQAGSPKVLDFGIARIIKSDESNASLYTTAYGFSGTLPYMSPEQVLETDSHVTAATDVYSLGVVAFELLTGRLPLDARGKSTLEAINQIRDEPALTLRDCDPSFAADINTVIEKALATEPYDRYHTTGEFAADINRYLAGKPVVARPIGRLGKAWRLAKRHPAVSILASLVLLLLVVGTIVSISFAVAASRANAAKSEALVLAIAESERAAEQEESALASLKAEQRLNYDLQLQRLFDNSFRQPHGTPAELSSETICPPYLRDFTWRLIYRHARRIRGPIKLGGESVVSCTVSPFRYTAAVADDRCQIQIIDIPSRRPTQVIKDDTLTRPPISLAFSKREEYLAARLPDNSMRVYDVRTGELCSSFTTSNAGRHDFQFGTDNELIVADGSASITTRPAPSFDVAVAFEPEPFKSKDETAQAVAVFPSGNFVAIAFRDRVAICDIKSNSVETAMLPDIRLFAPLSNDAELFACTYKRAYHIHRESLSHTLVFVEPTVLHGITAAGSRKLAVRTRKNGILISHLQPSVRQTSYRVYPKRTCYGAELSADGRFLLTRHSTWAEIWDLNLPPCDFGSAGGGKLNGIVPLEGKVFAIASEDGGIRLYDAAAGEIGDLGSDSEAMTLIAAAKNQRLFAACGPSTKIRLWSFSQELVATFDPPCDEVRKLEFLGDGRLAVFDADSLYLLDRAKPNAATHIEFGEPVTAAAILPSKNAVATCSESGELKMWPLAGGNVVTLCQLDSAATHLAISSDGQRIAAALANRTIALVPTKKNASPILCNDNTLDIAHLVFSPDGKTLAAAGNNTTVTLWDPVNGCLRLAFANQNLPFTGIAFSLSGETLAATTVTGTVAIWHGPN